jgi:hypothetical protein
MRIISVFGLVLSLALSACAAPVDVIPFTTETFPSKPSGDQVAVLYEKPARPYIEIAQLDVHSDMLGFERLQREILDRAAKLGADAVILLDSETYAQGRGGNKQSNGAIASANPHGQQSAYVIKSLRGFAIRYTEAGGR